MRRLLAGPARLIGQSCPLPSSFPPSVPAPSGGAGGRGCQRRDQQGAAVAPRTRVRSGVQGWRGRAAPSRSPSAPGGSGTPGGWLLPPSLLFPQPWALVPARRAVRAAPRRSVPSLPGGAAGRAVPCPLPPAAARGIPTGAARAPAVAALPASTALLNRPPVARRRAVLFPESLSQWLLVPFPHPSRECCVKRGGKEDIVLLSSSYS
ncbi:hypothetical protein Nmel_004397 [Mimus melanotis]